MSLYQTQIADRLEQFAETIVNVNDPKWDRKTFEEELRTIRTLAGCIEDAALMRRVSEGIDELLRPLHPHAAPFLAPGCVDTNLKRACALAEQARALASELRGVDAEPGAVDDGPADDGSPFYPAAHFDKNNVGSEMLRQAKWTGRIRARKVGGRNHYSEPDARRLWPDRFVASVTKRDRA